jgi:hypothetical protein
MRSGTAISWETPMHPMRLTIALSLGAALAMAAAGPVAAAQLPNYAGAEGTLRITSVDNSGAARSLTVRGQICKDPTQVRQVIEYKMNFGSAVSSDWKVAVSRGVNAGCSTGSHTDRFQSPLKARGVWARLCNDVPGPVNQCGPKSYISI